MHFGLSDITDDTLNKGVLLTLKVSRNPGGDESYAHFVSTSSVLTVLSDKSGRKDIGFSGAILAPDLNLQCYDLKSGNIKFAQK